MFAKSVVTCDAFLSLSFPAQAFYFQLCLQADDDGFITNAKMLHRMIGANDNELQELVKAGYLFEFDSGVVLVKHWKVNNQIKADRYKSTTCQEKNLVKIVNNIYEMSDSTDRILAQGQHEKKEVIISDDVKRVVDYYNSIAHTKYNYKQVNKRILAAFEKGQTADTLIKLTDEVLSKGEFVSPNVLYSGQYVEARF